MPHEINESDWKVLRRLHPVALERFCERVLTEIGSVKNDDARDFHERYLNIFKIVERHDREMARHTSVSWNLMLGRNPLLVAKQHGHRLTTMLSVYAAWTEGAVEADVVAIRDAMNRTDDGKQDVTPKSGREGATNSAVPCRIDGRRRPDRGQFNVSEVDQTDEIRFGSRFASSGVPSLRKALKIQENFGGKGGTRTTPAL